MTMHVDRAGFLVFATTLAACGAKTETPPPPVVIAEPEPIDEVPEPTARRDPPPAPSPAEESLPFPQNAITYDGSCRVTNVTRPAASGCDDNLGQPGNCSAVKLAGGCPSFQFICDQCEGYKRFFKPRVAQRAVSCVVSQTPSQLGDGCATYACGDMALKSACLDPTADAPCKAIAARCKTTVEECRGLLSGMNNAGRAEIAACAASGCSYGIWSCIEGM